MPIAFSPQTAGFTYPDEFLGANLPRPAYHLEASAFQPQPSQNQQSCCPSYIFQNILTFESLPAIDLEQEHKIRLIVPTEKITFTGHQSYGQIEIIGQVHTIYNEDTPTLKKIGICQEQVLLHLQARATQTIFVEGLWKDFPAQTYSQSQFSEFCFYLLPNEHAKNHQPQNFSGFIKNLFQNFQPGAEFTEEQKLYLGLIGAPYIYAICNPQVSLMKTISSEDDLRIPKLIEQHKNNSETVHFLRFELREYLALQEAKNYLERNPGTRVSIVYGSSHEFLPQADKVFRQNTPIITTVKWSSLENKLGWDNAA